MTARNAMPFNAPLSREKADRIIGLLDLAPGARVLDAGCGRGELLIRVVETSGAHGLGIDRDAEAIAAAKALAAERVGTDGCVFRAEDVREAALDPASFDLAMCIGSTHAFAMGDAAYPSALRHLARAVRPGGHLLVGEGYWKQPPAPEYLALIGEPVGIYHDHAGNVAIAEADGLVPLHAAVSNDDEWNDFEWRHRMAVEREAAERPDDPAMQERLARSRAWRDGYLRWGHATMGFGLYLFGKPAEANDPRLDAR